MDDKALNCVARISPPLMLDCFTEEIDRQGHVMFYNITSLLKIVAVSCKTIGLTNTGYAPTLGGVGELLAESPVLPKMYPRAWCFRFGTFSPSLIVFL
jgi:hypothetical protein